MPLVARASKTVRNKNLLIILMCAVFLSWFAYDGFVGWPAANDRAVAYMKGEMMPQGKLDRAVQPNLDQWKGWNNEDAATREQMSTIVKTAAKVGNVEGWKNPFDIQLQLWIVYGLAAATAASIWWLFHCQQRRAIAEETTVSPSKGVVVPWDKISRVDNTLWKKMGIVAITYSDPSGRQRKAEFDDYKLEREPLLSILDQLAEKALHAEFIPKEDTPPPSSAATDAQATGE